MKKIYTIILLLFTINNYSCMDVTAKMSQDIKNSKLISWLLYNNQNYVPAPGNVRADGVSESEITLTWEYHSNNINGFTIERSKTGNADDFKEIGAVVASYNSYNDNDANNDLSNSERLEANTFYHYRIKAYNEDSNSEYSKLVKVKTFTDLTWEKIFDMNIYNEAKSIKQTADGGYILTGSTGSQNTGTYDIWIIKLDDKGNKLWDKIYGGSGDDHAYSIQQTIDGGYIVAASLFHGTYGNDAWIIKLDGNGNIIWDKTFGGSKNDYVHSIQQTADKGYIVTGHILSSGTSQWDIWIFKLNENGNKEWDNTYEGNYSDYGYSIQQTIDGGYIIAGETYLQNTNRSNILILKLDKNGNREWTKTYGDANTNIGYSIQQTIDGGYIVAGFTCPYEFEGNMWILKLDKNGNKIWDKIYGGNYYDWAYSIQQTIDGGYIVAGLTYSYGDHNFSDMWILKLDGNGNRLWDKNYIENSSNDTAYSIQQTIDGGYIVAGNRGDDIWILKLNEIGEYEK